METRTLKEIHEDVPPDFYDTSMKVNLVQRVWHKRRFRWITKLVSEMDGRVLDVGCDGGNLTEIVAAKTGAREVVGIDISHETVAYSKTKLPQYDFAVGHAEELPFRDAAFDMIFCSEVLEHVDHPDKLLAEMKRCLKKDGYCIVEVPTENWVFKTIWFFWTRFGRGRAWHHAHVVDFRGDLLHRLVKDAGFRVDRESVFLGMLRAAKIRPV